MLQIREYQDLSAFASHVPTAHRDTAPAAQQQVSGGKPGKARKGAKPALNSLAPPPMQPRHFGCLPYDALYEGYFMDLSTARQYCMLYMQQVRSAHHLVQLIDHGKGHAAFTCDAAIMDFCLIPQGM